MDIPCRGWNLYSEVLAVSRRCRLKKPPTWVCGFTVPLRPRRNPNRIGYWADAAEEKRTAGIRGIRKRLGNPRRRLYVYLLFDSLAIPIQY